MALDKTGVSIIDIIPLCHAENAFKMGKNKEMWLYGGKSGTFIIDIVFHTILLKWFKRAQIQEMWLRFYTGYLDINVWYNIVGRYSNL